MYEGYCMTKNGIMDISVHFTHPGLEFSDHALALPLGEGLGFLQPDSDLSDFHLQLLPQGFCILVVVLFHTQFLRHAGILRSKTVSTLLSSTAGIEGLIEVTLGGFAVYVQIEFKFVNTL